MSRLNLENQQSKTLEELIPEYAENKAKLDKYKKICDSENAEIKEQMFNRDLEEITVDGYTAKRSVSIRETLNEERLLTVLKQFWAENNGSMQCPFIQTKEYVDMDALENYLYNNELSPEMAAKLESCRVKTEVVTLRIKKAKRKDD